MSFDQFSIHPRCLAILKKQGITTPMPIQAKAIPAALEGRDIVAIAQTGTGKTLAFALPALTLLAGGACERNAMLVLTPTRELAVQVNSVIEQMGKPLNLTSVCIYGGASIELQARALRKGCNIIVATPGRLLDHMGRGNIRFNGLSILVLDEADRMLDMGFLPDIRRILGKLPAQRQTMMFSATFASDIARLAEGMQKNSVRIEIEATSPAAETVEQNIYTVDQAHKTGLLSKILVDPCVKSALVFSRTKHRTDRLAKALTKGGFKVQAIHGDRTQRQRQDALDGFKKGKFNILVATDVAARGLDIRGLSHVINYDIPNSPDEYIHRIGRTGRANDTGSAITFVSPEECRVLGAIEKTLGRNLPREEWEGAVPVLSLFKTEKERASMPSRNSTQRRRRLLRRA